MNASFPTLETERLRLRLFTESDLDAYWRMCSDPEVMRYIGGKPLTRREAWDSMARALGHWHLRGYGLWAVEEKETGALVGRFGLYYPEGWPGLELGLLLDRSCWGRGYATEAGRAVLDHAFSALDADHVVSVIARGNKRSIRAVERLGMRFERSMELDGNRVVIYGIDRPD